jgi:hypothetical protein
VFLYIAIDGDKPTLFQLNRACLFLYLKKCFYKILISFFLIFLNDFNMLILKKNKEGEGSLL